MSFQWIIEDAGYGFYYIKSGKGGYVSFDGVASSGTPLICSVTKQRFRIIQDSLDSSLIKYVLGLYTPFSYLLGYIVLTAMIHRLGCCTRH